MLINFDYKIISILEKIWMKLHVSPYEISRFLIVGTILCFMWSSYLLGASWLGCLWLINLSVMYKKVAKHEKENDRQHFNSAKESRLYSRLFSFAVLIMWSSFTLLVLLIESLKQDHYSTLAQAASWFLYLSADYTMALNWIRPPPKAAFNRLAEQRA